MAAGLEIAMGELVQRVPPNSQLPDKSYLIVGVQAPTLKSPFSGTFFPGIFFLQFM